VTCELGVSPEVEAGADMPADIPESHTNIRVVHKVTPNWDSRRDTTDCFGSRITTSTPRPRTGKFVLAERFVFEAAVRDSSVLLPCEDS
jgi:hypothetical protein